MKSTTMTILDRLDGQLIDNIDDQMGWSVYGKIETKLLPLLGWDIDNAMDAAVIEELNILK